VARQLADDRGGSGDEPWRLSPRALRLPALEAAYVVAGREISIVFSALIGSLWMGEGDLRRRLAGAAVVAAGVACVALAR
jgi:hypothetical protein